VTDESPNCTSMCRKFAVQISVQHTVYSKATINGSKGVCTKMNALLRRRRKLLTEVTDIS